MKPTKSESVSRQSSILKAPKQRQPLQCVAPNPSSSENSPTVKIKRRVSFAKNRRIRQFCNEEQETVWDNTYEEHDSSNTKSSSGGSPEKPLIISVPLYDKENFPVQLFLKDNQLDCKEVPTNVPNEDRDNLSQCDMEMDNSLINPKVGMEIQNNENEVPNTTIYCDEGMDMTSYEPANIIPCRTGGAILDDTELVSQTCTQDASMELTENVPSILHKNFNKEQKNVNSTDLTQALSKLLGNGRLNNQSENIFLEDVSESTNTVAMQFASNLPSSTWIKPNTPCSNNENTEIFNDKTMEFTAALPHSSIQSTQKLYNKTRLSERTDIFSNKSMEITEAVPAITKALLIHSTIKGDNQNLIQEKTEIFGNKSMEMTEAISSSNKNLYSEETNRILNTSTETMEFTSAVPYTNIKTNANNQGMMDKTRPSEKTEIFMNKSMEMTEAVAIDQNLIIGSNSKLDNQNLIEDKTEMFCNKSMEMTEAVSNYDKKCVPGEKTRILNVSMEMTEIPNLNKIHQKQGGNYNNETMEFTAAVQFSNIQSNTNPTLCNKTVPSERTEIFLNKSMDITEAVPFINKGLLNSSNLKQNHQNLIEEKTEIFCNKSMEMTEGISNSNKKFFAEESTRILNTSMEMTGIPILNKIQKLNTENFNNQTMEFTTAVSHTNIQSKENNQKMVDKMRAPEKTKIFMNKSMEMTEAVAVDQNLITNSNSKLDNQNLSEDKTEMFCNKSMEMTEAISNSNKKLIPEEKSRILNTSMEMTEIPNLNKIHQKYRGNYNNETMDFTSAVQCSNIKSKGRPLEHTEIFLNRSMEITEAVPNLNRDCLRSSTLKLNNQNLMEDKTEMFCNKSMEMTEAISNYNKKCFPERCFPEEKTRILNASMEMTEIPVLNEIHELHRANLNNVSMEFTTAVPYYDIPTNSNHPKLNNKTQPSERTEIFANKSMEITEAVPIFNKDLPNNFEAKGSNQYIFEEKTEMFCNKSMEMTEAVSNYNKNIYPSEKTRILNTSMEMTGIPICSKIIQDKTKLFLDKSMDLTEAIPINQQVLKSNLITQNSMKNHEQTKVFMDKSIDLTEAVMADIDNFVTGRKAEEIPLHINKNSKSETSLHTDINSRLSLQVNKETSLKHAENVPALSKNYNLQSKNFVEENYLNTNDARKIYQNNFMELTSGLSNLHAVEKEFPLGAKCNSFVYRQSRLDEPNKEYQDISMDYTESDILSFSKSNPKQMQASNIQRNLSSRDNKEVNKFKRLTTDELQILCASLNLPTQKAEKEQSVISQNNFITEQNFITDCNDVNVLRDSLKNKSNFQKSNIISEIDKNKSFNIASEVNTDLGISFNLNTERVTVEQTSLDRVHGSPSIMDYSAFAKNVSNKSEVLQNDLDFSKTNVLSNVTVPALMEMDGTVEISLARPELLEMSCSSTKIISAPASEKVPSVFNHKDSDAIEISMAEPNFNSAHPIIETNDKKTKVQIYHDISMEFSSTQPTLTKVKRKSSEKNQSPVSKKNFISYGDRSVYATESVNSSKENSLSRMPSDSTDVLVATMGFKTDLPHPLIINEKTTITVSTKSFSNKTYSIGASSAIQSEIQADKTYVVNRIENQMELNRPETDKKQQEDENIEQVYKIPVVENNEENEKHEPNTNKEIDEPSLRKSLIPEQNLEELEEIQPPSFLDSDSIQDASLENREMQNDVLSDSVLNHSNKEQSNSFLHKDENIPIDNIALEENHPSDVIRRLSNVDLNPPKNIKPKSKTHSKKNKVKKIEEVEEIASKEIAQEIVAPLTPFELLTENIKANEKRDDCIWSIRSLNSNIVAVDFISKSLVIVIRLNPVDMACTKDIKCIEIISQLRSDSKNILLKIVHNLLVTKLMPEELIEKYKMYEDVVPMLEYISSEVIFAMNFMFDIERLNATNLFDIEEERVSFMIASKKTNIILKVCVSIKVFNEIKADDVHVTCILGNIRKNDIKQLIVNIKKDSKFLSRYIHDVRDYITLMEESTGLNKH